MIFQASNLMPNQTAFDFSNANVENGRGHYATPFSFYIKGNSNIYAFSVEIYNNETSEKIYESGVISEGSILDENLRPYSTFSKEVNIKPDKTVGGTNINLSPSNNLGNSIKVNLFLPTDNKVAGKVLQNNRQYNWILKQYYEKNLDGTINTSLFVRNNNTYFVSKTPITVGLKAYNLDKEYNREYAEWEDGAISTKSRTLYIEGDYTTSLLNGAQIGDANHQISTIRWKTYRVKEDGQEFLIDDTGTITTSSIAYSFNHFLSSSDGVESVLYRIELEMSFMYQEDFKYVQYIDESGETPDVKPISKTQIFVRPTYSIIGGIELALKAYINNKRNRAELSWNMAGIVGKYYTNAGEEKPLSSLLEQFKKGNVDTSKTRTTTGIEILKGDRVKFEKFSMRDNKILFVRTSNILNSQNATLLEMKVGDDKYVLKIVNYYYALFKNNETTPLQILNGVDDKVADFWHMNLLAITTNPNNYLTIVAKYRRVGRYPCEVYHTNLDAVYNASNKTLYPSENLFPSPDYYILPVNNFVSAPALEYGNTEERVKELTLFEGLWDYVVFGAFDRDELMPELEPELDIYNKRLLPIWADVNNGILGRPNWGDLDAAFIGNFEKSLEAGDLSVNGETIDAWYIARTEESTGITEYVGTIDTSYNKIYDYSVPNNWQGTYSLTPISLSLLGHPIEAETVGEFKTCWWNYSLTFLNEPDNLGTRTVKAVFYWDLNSSSGEHSINTSYSVVETLGKYKKVGKSETNVLSGTLSTLLGYTNTEDGVVKYVGDSVKTIEKLRELIQGNYEKVLRDKQGNSIPIEFTSPLSYSYMGDVAYKTKENGGTITISPTEISLQWIEIEMKNLTAIEKLYDEYL